MLQTEKGLEIKTILFKFAFNLPVQLNKALNLSFVICTYQLYWKAYIEVVKFAVLPR